MRYEENGYGAHVAERYTRDGSSYWYALRSTEPIPGFYGNPPKPERASPLYPFGWAETEQCVFATESEAVEWAVAIMRRAKER